MWVGFLVSQLYIASRVFVKLAFWGSEIVALQMQLAYDGFVRTNPVVQVPFDDMRAPNGVV